MKNWTPEQVGFIILVSTIPLSLLLLMMGKLITGDQASPEALRMINDLMLAIIGYMAGLSKANK